MSIRSVGHFQHWVQRQSTTAFPIRLPKVSVDGSLRERAIELCWAMADNALLRKLGNAILCLAVLFTMAMSGLILINHSQQAHNNLETKIRKAGEASFMASAVQNGGPFVIVQQR
jgi:hypothetical protein